MKLGDAVVRPHPPVRPVPVIFDAVDVPLSTDEALVAGDPDVEEIRYVLGAVARKAVRGDNSIRHDHVFHDRHCGSSW